MNDTTALIFISAMLGLLILWSMAQIMLFVRRNAYGQYAMRTRHFMIVPIAKTSLVRPRKAARVRATLAKTPQVATPPVGVAVMNSAVEAASTPARPTPPVEVTVRPTDIRMPTSFFRDLRGVDFHGRDLTGVNWNHCNLVGVNLEGVNLQGAELAYADFTDANLMGANLSECDCTCARFHGANLTSANLRNSNLTDTRFGPTERLGSELHRLRGEGRYPRRMVELTGANLWGVDITGADCTGSDIERGRNVKDLHWTQW